MEYGLARLVIGSSKFVPLAEADYDRIRRCQRILREVLSVEQKFDLLIDNYLAFETHLLDLSAREMLRDGTDWAQLQDQRNQINGRVLNLLSACRLYIDHCKHHIGTVQFEASDLKATVVSLFSAEYDLSFGYRFMEALRNYVQHRGYPVHGVIYDGRRAVNDSGFVFRVSPYLDVTQLEEDGKFKAAVLTEVKGLGPPRIDLKSLAREYIGGLSKVHEAIRRQLRNVVSESDLTVRKMIDEYQNADPPEGSILGLAAVRREHSAYSDPIPLFEDLLDYRASFEKKNRVLTNLARRFVTGEATGVN